MLTLSMYLFGGLKLFSRLSKYSLKHQLSYQVAQVKEKRGYSPVQMVSLSFSSD